MCNLSQGVEERGIEKGIEKGIAIGEARGREEEKNQIILNMYNNGFTSKQIAIAVNKTAEEIDDIIVGK